ncbi:MAG: MFS transporter [bacterium]|nr:MFS transporter [bacterium]
MKRDKLFSSAKERLTHTLRAFRYRNYRLFFFGQGVSLIGTWMQQIAGAWLVYRLTDSPFMLGLVSFASLIPNLFITPFGGVIADRFDRRKIMYITQTSLMVFALMLAFLVYTDRATIELIFLLTLLAGIMNAVDAPTRHSFIFEIVTEKEDLVNAIALNSAMFNGARLIGPAVAGLIIASFGEQMCFLLNGISFLSVLIALFMMKIEKRKIETNSNNFFFNFKEGFKYSYNHRAIKSILILVTVISVFGMSYNTLLPVYVKETLGSGPKMLGFMMGSIGFGAFSGAIFIASRKHFKTLVKLISIAGSIFGTGLVLLSLSRVPALSLSLMFLVGFGMVSQVSVGNTILQTIVDDRMRGRVMSFYNLAFLGMAPIGNLLMGYLAKKEILGVTSTLLLSGGICIVISLTFLLQIKNFKAKLEEQDGI